MLLLVQNKYSYSIFIFLPICGPVVSSFSAMSIIIHASLDTCVRFFLKFIPSHKIMRSKRIRSVLGNTKLFPM